jgi:RNA polymerase sigma-70 factor (ECF subfamily)
LVYSTGAAAGPCYTAGVSGDFELLQAWRDGDREAGDALLRRHFDSVCRFFRSKLGDDVEDLIQRTFLDSVESRDRVREGASFRAYLFSIARRRLYDHLRVAYRRVETDVGNHSLADLGTSPTGKLARGQEERLLLAAMERIPVDFRIALELAYWEGMRGPDIAMALGIEENTVRSRLSRARAALREQIETLAPTPELATSTVDGLEQHLRGVAG